MSSKKTCSPCTGEALLELDCASAHRYHPPNLSSANPLLQASPSPPLTLSSKPLNALSPLSYRHCTERGLKVRELWAGLLNYHRNQTKGRSGENLYDFIYSNLRGHPSNGASVGGATVRGGEVASVGGGGSDGKGDSQTVEYSIQ